jgi:hypothetical protein
MERARRLNYPVFGSQGHGGVAAGLGQTIRFICETQRDSLHEDRSAMTGSGFGAWRRWATLRSADMRLEQTISFRIPACEEHMR